MMTINQVSIRKILAREWLYFLAAAVVGLAVVPGILGLFFGEGVAATYGEFYEAFFDRYNRGLVLLYTFSPYFLFQLVRSIRWALKANRESR